jgi:hypothetical protein
LDTQVSLLPPVAAIAISVTAGPLADGLIERGWPVARVRKLAQTTAFLCPTACLLAAANCEDGPTSVGARLFRPLEGQSFPVNLRNQSKAFLSCRDPPLRLYSQRDLS